MMSMREPLISSGPVPSTMSRTTPSKPHDWDSPAYEVLTKHNLIRLDWRVAGVEELQFLEGNTTPTANCLRSLACGCCLFRACCKMAEVPAGTLRKMEDGFGGFQFLGNRGPYRGIHFYCDAFMRIDPKNVHLNSSTSATDGVTIHNGDQWIVIIPQGFIGLALDMGQPVLLPPGMHQWRSATMCFDKCVDLTKPVIALGPYTLLTVDKGYEAVTQNNGMQQVLEGGAVHLLTHRNHKFEKFISTKIMTDDLQRVEVMTGDNVLMSVTATVCWNISNVQQCAERAAETMDASGTGRDTGTISKLRGDVLKQAEASLSALIGKVNFSDTFSAATQLQYGSPQLATGVVPGQRLPEGISAEHDARRAPSGGAAERAATSSRSHVTKEAEHVALLFDDDKLRDAVTHANDMTIRYGVEVLSINIISAKPADMQLMQSLAKGAVAAAEAQQLETAARGQAKADAIAAQGRANALKISAQAESDAEVTRAEGRQQAAKLLNEEDVAVSLATIAATGEALSHAKSSLIMTREPGQLSSMMLANPSIKLTSE